jgi:hypothetical protein
MLAARELIDRPPVFARAEPDDEYEFPKPEPLDPWTIDQDERNQRDEEIEDEDEDDE